MPDLQEKTILEKRLKALGGSIIAVAAFSAVVNILFLAVPFYTMQLFERVLSSRSTETLLLLSLIVVFLLVLQAAVDMVRGLMLSRMGTRLERDVGGHALHTALSQAAIGRPETAQSLRDLSNLRQLIASPTLYAVFDAPWLPFFLFIAWLLHPAIGQFALIGVVIIAGLGALQSWSVNRALRENDGDAIALIDSIDATFDRASSISAMGMMYRTVARWSLRNDQVLKNEQAVAEKTIRFTAIIKGLRQAMQGGIMGLGVYLTIEGQLNPGAMIAASITMGRALAPVEQAVGGWRHWVEGFAAYRRLVAHLKMARSSVPSVPLTDVKADLRVEGLYYAPNGPAKAVIRGVSCNFVPGDITVIIGDSGAGKTSFIRLLLGLALATGGRVTFDGVDTAKWNRDDLGQYIGYVPQDVDLISGTISENIARFGDASVEDIVQAAKMAGAHDLIMSMPNAYDTPVGLNGVPISGGERQRIALARACFGKTKLLILDEPDSNLDPLGQQALFSAIQQAKQNGWTVIIVSHRPAIFQHADRIMKFEAGHLVYDGSPDGLSSAPGMRALPSATAKKTPLQLNGLDSPGKGGSSKADNGNLSEIDTRYGPAIVMKDWPAIDRASWAEALNQNSLKEGVKMRDRSDNDRRETAIAYGCWLAWLQTFDALDIDAAPASRMASQRLRTFWNHKAETLDTESLDGFFNAFCHAVHGLNPDGDMYTVLTNIRHETVERPDGQEYDEKAH